MTSLPPALRGALEARLIGQSRRNLARRSDGISAAYRGRKNSAATLLTADDALAYAVARMPATFAAMERALRELAASRPGFEPASVLDVGCGPGTATFAAAQAFPRLERVALLDRNGPFLGLAEALVASVLPDQKASFIATDLARSNEALPVADLVTAGYVLAELPAPAQVGLIRSLWSAASMVLVLTEPGTPDGFQRIHAARQELLALGAHIAAPCTHDAACPMAAVAAADGPRWCRFPVRVTRSRDHMALKAGSLPYEDEPVAYLVATRAPPIRAARRIVGPAEVGKAAIVLPTCGASGLEAMTAPRREAEKYKLFKKLDWGDTV